MPFLFRFAPWKIGDVSQSASEGTAPAKRMPSGLCTDSIFTTSAPRLESRQVAKGPAQNAVRSTTRSPSKAGFTLDSSIGVSDVAVSGSDASIAARSAPSRGADRNPGSGMPVTR